MRLSLLSDFAISNNGKLSADHTKYNRCLARILYFCGVKNNDMLKTLEELKSDDYQQLLDAFPLIAVLIGSADGYIEQNEIESAHRVTVIRSHSFDADLKPFYRDVSKGFLSKIEDVIDVAPRKKEELQTFLSAELEKCSPILAQLRDDLAVRILESMRSYAKHIAEASGGFLNYLSISSEEDDLVNLDMISYDSSI